MSKWRRAKKYAGTVGKYAAKILKGTFVKVPKPVGKYAAKILKGTFVKVPKLVFKIGTRPKVAKRQMQKNATCLLEVKLEKDGWETAVRKQIDNFKGSGPSGHIDGSGNVKLAGVVDPRDFLKVLEEMSSKWVLGDLRWGDDEAFLHGITPPREEKKETERKGPFRFRPEQHHGRDDDHDHASHLPFHYSHRPFYSTYSRNPMCDDDHDHHRHRASPSHHGHMCDDDHDHHRHQASPSHHGHRTRRSKHHN